MNEAARLLLEQLEDENAKLQQRIAELEAPSDTSQPVLYAGCLEHAHCHNCGAPLLNVSVRRGPDTPLRVIAAQDCPARAEHAERGA